MKIFFYSVDIKIIVVIIMFNSDKHKTKILRKKNEKYILCIYSKYYLLKTMITLNLILLFVIRNWLNVYIYIQ